MCALANVNAEDAVHVPLVLACEAVNAFNVIKHRLNGAALKVQPVEGRGALWLATERDGHTGRWSLARGGAGSWHGAGARAAQVPMGGSFWR